MKTASEVVDKHIGFWSVKYPNYIHDSYMQAIKEIAALSFEAGGKYTAERFIDHMIEVQKPAPTKKQFLSLLFPEQ